MIQDSHNLIRLGIMKLVLKIEGGIIMFFNFTLRHFLANPHYLAEQLQTSSMRGFEKRVLFVFLSGFVLFGIRSLWGINTASLTPILTTMTTADYTLARYASLFGSLGWSLIYVSFHLFGVAFVLNLVLKIPFKKLLPLQLLMTSLLLMEKALVSLVFMVKGVSANISFLSFGPLAATFLKTEYIILFMNQLTITTAIIVAFQYSFICSYTQLTRKKRLLWTLIGIHLVMALITAAVGFIPVESLFETITGGGAGIE